MRCLIIGATGLIGSNVATACDARGHSHAGTWYRRPTSGYTPLDVRDADTVAELVHEYEPEVVFLAAGSGDPDAADHFPDDSRDILVGGAEAAATAVQMYGGTLVSFSTDRVFSPGPKPRKEDEAASPASTFGRHHVEAEDVIRTALPGRHLILRTTSAFGPAPRPHGLVSQVLRSLEAGDEFDAAPNRLIQPTFAPDLATAALDLLDREATGTYHVAGPERMTEAAVARMVAFAFGHDSDRIRPVAGDGSEPAWLDRSRLRTLLGMKAIRSPGDGLRALRDGVPAVALARAA